MATETPADDPKKDVKPCADDVPPAAELETLKAENEALKKQIEELTKALESAGVSIALSDKTPANIIAALAVKAASSNDLQQRLKVLELNDTKRQIDELIALGRAQGKITDAAEPMLRKMTVQALSDYLPLMPEVVAKGKLPALSQSKTLDAVALSDCERKVALQLGLTEEQMLDSKKKITTQGGE